MNARSGVTSQSVIALPLRLLRGVSCEQPVETHTGLHIPSHVSGRQPETLAWRTPRCRIPRFHFHCKSCC
jgi:hypothetical protein